MWNNQATVLDSLPAGADLRPVPKEELSHGVSDEDLEMVSRYRKDWCAFSRDILREKLDSLQEQILHSVQVNRRTVVRSCHARGKDRVAANASICNLLLEAPSKTIMTAPTGRQVVSIMMSEVRTIWKQAERFLSQRGLSLGGVVQATKVLIYDEPDRFLEGFKAQDKATEAWTGFHSPHLLLVVTEASGVEDMTYQTMEGILTGESRLLLVGNPNKQTGEFAAAFRSDLYEKFVLSAFDAPNVVHHKILIPGQVDYDWLDVHVRKPGWCSIISADQVCKDLFDFEWNGVWYRPNDLFLVKALGQFPRQDEYALVPFAWIEQANIRWEQMNGDHTFIPEQVHPLRLGLDVAGMGRDLTVFAPRYGDFVDKLILRAKQDHMATVGEALVQMRNKKTPTVFVDTIGEGAGVYSRLKEMEANAISFKGSNTVRARRDKATQTQTFANMRAFCYWALRDALNPEMGGNLALPPDEALTEELLATTWKHRSDGSIIIDPKEKIQETLKRSPDRADAVMETFNPFEQDEEAVSSTGFTGVGVF